MIGALVLGLWLFLTLNRDKQPFWEASLFTFVVLAIASVIQWRVPTLGWYWLLSWSLRWLFAFIAFWLVDILVTSMVSGIVFAVACAVVFYFLDQYAFAIVYHGIQQWLNLDSLALMR